MSKVKYLLDNDPSDLELTFTEEVFDQSSAPVGEVELKPGGRDIAVTELNRHEYLHLLACVPLFASASCFADFLLRTVQRVPPLEERGSADRRLQGGIPRTDYRGI